MFNSNNIDKHLKIQRFLSKESIDKKKINRIIFMHSRKNTYNLSSGIRKKLSLLKLDQDENRKDACFNILNNVNQGDSILLSKNFDEIEKPKENENEKSNV